MSTANTDRVSGGHRKFTHTIFFAALLVPLVDLVMLRAGEWGEWVIATLGFYLMAMVLRLAPRRGAGEVVFLAEALAATATYQHFVGEWYRYDFFAPPRCAHAPSIVSRPDLWFSMITTGLCRDASRDNLNSVRSCDVL